MSRITLYHNPGCSKSRAARALLEERGADFETIRYLESPPSRAELERIVASIDDPPEKLVRKDKNWQTLGLEANEYTEAGPVVSVLLEHPAQMERPVVLKGDRGVIARPPERVLELLDD